MLKDANAWKMIYHAQFKDLLPKSTLRSATGTKG